MKRIILGIFILVLSISSALVVSSPAHAASKQVKITDSSTYINQKANPNSKRLKLAKKGQTYTYISWTKGKGYAKGANKIKVGSKTGYVSAKASKVVTKTAPLSATTISKTKTAKKTKQILTVQANHTTKATVILWQKDSKKKWKKVRTMKGIVGKGGVGTASESSTKTPKGSYKLGFAFGTSNPGTKVPFRKIKSNSYWSGTKGKTYNTWQNKYHSKKDEHLASYPSQYQYAMVIEYNMHPVKQGKGSAFFLHIDNKKYTYTLGCVAVPKNDMKYLMKKLNGAYIINVNKASEVKHY